ncbi:resuscitation-promoting factor [Aeromicrobium wangtongii]|uniref:resuscitation-promoting factor n=1 Tax=Aeromicrobium wangtongii TaxID=2969247 RepID=UPI002016DADE|nr:resuscitation-promoting factor [Aeromicrobium wangtongii]MCL3817300.1 transglycosylase family protein [Aeromicrobium wangtongii]
MRTPTKYPTKRTVLAATAATAAAAAVAAGAIGLNNNSDSEAAPFTKLAMTAPGQLQVDGEPASTIVRTDASLARQMADIYPGADISVSRSAERPTLKVITPSDVTVIADGTKKTVTTTGLKSRDVLADASIPLGKHDKVRIKRPENRPAEGFGDGATIRVVRVAYDVSYKTRTLEPGTVTRKDASLPAGTRKKVSSGKEGTQRIRVTKVLHDGDLTRTVRKVRSQKPAKDAVILVGTAPKPRPAAKNPGSAAPKPSSDGLNWAALAKCEAGGNPKAYNAAGYYGLYQFDLQTWRSVGGSGKPSDASASEQTARAQKLYASRGASPWPVCGKQL